MTAGPIALVPGKSDAELAAAHREAIVSKLEEILPLLDAAKRDGFDVGWNLGLNAFGKCSIAQFKIMREF